MRLASFKLNPIVILKRLENPSGIFCHLNDVNRYNRPRIMKKKEKHVEAPSCGGCSAVFTILVISQLSRNGSTWIWCQTVFYEVLLHLRRNTLKTPNIYHNKYFLKLTSSTNLTTIDILDDFFKLTIFSPKLRPNPIYLV